MLFRRNRRADGPASAAAPGSEPEPALGATGQLAAIASLSSALVRAKDKHAVARILIDTCFSLLGVDLAAVALISEDGKRAQGLLAASADGDLDWWTRRRASTSTASRRGSRAPSSRAARSSSTTSRAPSRSTAASPNGAVRRARSSSRSSRRRRCPPCSCSRRPRRRASSRETSCRCCRRSPPRLRSHSIGRSSADALADALERERLVASIGRKVRSELDLDDVLRVAVEATGLCDRCQPLLPQARRTGRADADRRRVDGSGVRSRSEPSPTDLAVSNLAARDRRTVAVGDIREESALERSDARRDGDAARARQPRRARDAGPRVRPDDRDLRAPPLGAGRVVGGGDRARRGRRARAGDRDPRGAAPPRERAAPRAADGAPQGGPGRDERAAARDRPPAARGRGDEAARCGRGRLLPLRLGQFAPPLRGRPRARPGARRASSSWPSARSTRGSASPCRTRPTRGSRARSRRR